MDLIKHLLFNYSILLVCFFIFHIWAERLGFGTSRMLWFYGLFVALLACFLFALPYHHDTFRFDLRVIPILIAGLYHGMGPIFVVFAIFFRGLLEIGDGFYVTILVFGPLGVILWYLHPKFKRFSTGKKYIWGMGLAFSTNLTALLLMGYLGNRVDSVTVWIAYIIIPTLGMGLITYLLEFILQNKVLRDIAIKSKKLEAVEHMGAAISHEVRNPLTSAKGFFQLIQEQENLSDKTREYAFIGISELNQAERVIKDYLTFSKPTLNKMEQIEVSKELDLILSILQPLANQSSVEIVTYYEDKGMLLGDRTKFHQCFINVIKNAIESMPNGGIVTIRTNTFEKNVSIMIEDEGIGMTKEQLERLGEPYYSTKDYKGTGLGMMVVYSIVKAMKGQIKVHSELGMGTTCEFHFPTENKN
ncbi:HAMP domain-containing sensor histidine kinase [Bacillus sp. 31A1R]|uniref:histidine kinase n=1 Tax=Robertmurraya mangrovi TaxID=3098077 RepID=A0ABU5J0C6_9BACI|nr:HAMP domain-containing sensor histidine kinase [Bacillus sp. 31A1R]MDZ5472851.1 HAMP domain-containing sensor histidine kinase [Bacillus sp. 31A1R]